MIWVYIDVRDCFVPCNVCLPRSKFYFALSILSFGAPQSNVYKVIVEGRGSMTFETNQVSAKNKYWMMFSDGYNCNGGTL